MPFQVIGHPGYSIGSFVFTPHSIPGVSEHPPYEGIPCYGQNLTSLADNIFYNKHHFTLNYLLATYDFFKDSSNFFSPYFEKLAGNSQLQEQIMSGLDEKAIHKSWEQSLQEFRQIRAKYLLYQDYKE